MSVLRNHRNAQEKTSELPEMQMVECRLFDILNRAQGSIRECCINLLSSGGKRVRPLLTLSSGLCFKAVNEELLSASVAGELIHMASLVHDDIIDEALTRRGIPTTNSVLGNAGAVLAGDYLFAEAFKIMCGKRLSNIMEYMVEAIQKMCAGEVNQADELFSLTVNTESYFKRIGSKTAALIAACCRSGAAASGANQQEVVQLGEYGLNLGYAYQIVDDILDFTSNPDKLGKPSGTDFCSGNITMPVILLKEDPVYAQWLCTIFTANEFTLETVSKMTEALQNSGCIAKAYIMASVCVERAKESLADIPNSLYKANLIRLADKTLSRQA